MKTEYGAEESSEEQYFDYLRKLRFIISDERVGRRGSSRTPVPNLQNGVAIRKEIQSLIFSLESQSTSFKNNKRLATHSFLVKEVCITESVAWRGEFN